MTYYLMFKISNFESAFSLSTACHWFWKPSSTTIYTEQSLPLSLRFLSSTLFLCLHNNQLITIFNSNLNVLFGFFTVFFTFMNDFFFSLLLSSFYFLIKIIAKTINHLLYFNFFLFQIFLLFFKLLWPCLCFFLLFSSLFSSVPTSDRGMWLCATWAGRWNYLYCPGAHLW